MAGATSSLKLSYRGMGSGANVIMSICVIKCGALINYCIKGT